MGKMTEREKMELGLWYDTNYDQQLVKERERAADLCFDLEHTKPSNAQKRKQILAELFPNVDGTTEVLQPVYCDYGHNIYMGKQCFLNHNCYLMDGAKITIGNNVFIGPSCGFYTANHPLDHKSRNMGLEKAQPITIGDNVWLGANVVVLPGVTIGHSSVIGAGSVVTSDIPEGVIAMGVPCKVIRKITEDDRVTP